MNIELIQGTLEVNESPGMETTDPRFSDMASLVQEGKYEEAAILAKHSRFIIDATSILDGMSNAYEDFAHYTEAGNESIAQFVFQYLRSNPDGAYQVVHAKRYDAGEADA